MLVKGLLTAARRPERWHTTCPVRGHRARLCHSHRLLLHRGATLQLFQLIQNVATIVAWLPHSLVEIVESGVGHFEGLVGDGSHSS